MSFFTSQNFNELSPVFKTKLLVHKKVPKVPKILKILNAQRNHKVPKVLKILNPQKDLINRYVLNNHHSLQNQEYVNVETVKVVNKK